MKKIVQHIQDIVTMRYHRTIGVLTLKCYDMTVLISKHLDVPLSTVERMRIRWHQRHCPPCRHYEEQLRYIHQALRKHAQYMEKKPHDVPHHHVPPSDIGLSDQTKQVVKERLLKELSAMQSKDSPS